MPRQQRVSAMVRANAGHICDAPACNQHRTSLSRYCTRHHSNLERNGHPTAGPVRAAHWAPYRSKVREVYQANASHQGLKKALQWVGGWMLQASCDDAQKAWASEVARLQRHGCTSLDVVVELAAVYAYLQDHPRATLSDGHRDFAYSKAVLGLAPRPRRVTADAVRKGSNGYAPKPKPAALKHVGPYLVRLLAPLLVTTHQALQTEAQRARAEVDSLSQPFSPTPSAIARAAQATTIQETP